MPRATDKAPRRRRLDARMRTSLAAVAISGALLTLGALVFGGASSALSVGIGAGLALGNLWALARIVVALLPDGSGRTPSAGLGGWALLGMLKMVGLLGAVWLLMRHRVVSPLPLVIGFGALPIGIAIGALVSDRGGE
jgi:hypothetical protein